MDKQEELKQKLKSAQDKADRYLRQIERDSKHRDDLDAKGIEALSQTLEELRVTEEELRVQNDELAETRLTIEAERARYLELFEFAPDGYLVTDLQGIIKEANQKSGELLAVRAERLMGKPLANYVCEDDRKEFRRQLNHLPKVGKLREWDFRLQDREGDLFPVTTTVAAMPEDADEVSELRWILRDITERVRTREKLEESEARYRSLFNSVPVAIWEVDFSAVTSAVSKLESDQEVDPQTKLENPRPQNRLRNMINIRDVNEAALTMFGAEEKQELLGSPEKIFTPDSDQSLRDEILATRENKRFFQGETVLRTLQGETLNVLLTMNIPHRSGKLDTVLISMMDITERKKLERAVQKLAIEDPLVGCFNRRHFYSLAEKELARAARYEHPLSVVMIDLDHFKQVNDEYGHSVGDQVLIAVADRMGSILRETDIFARYGGEEFIALLPETKLAEAVLVAERLRMKAAEPLEIDQSGVTTSASLGVAALESGEQIDIDTLADRADQALYAAKQAGRDQVKVWPIKDQE